MQGFSPKLPLVYDATEDGLYGLNKTILETIRQNLKMLLLTNPGERMMDSKFGVGVKKYLFEHNDEDTRMNLSAKIQSQVAKYLDYIEIEDIEMSDPGSNDENTLFINIKYNVPALSTSDELNIIL